MRRYLVLSMVVLALLLTTLPNDSEAGGKAKCFYVPMPCGCIAGSCVPPQEWIECCCVAPVNGNCYSYCGCQPADYSCIEDWGKCEE